MAIGDSETDSAASRLAQLDLFFRQHPVTGPSGHSYISSEARPTATAPGLPYNAGIVDHIDRSVAEVVQHTRAANPDAGPLPQHVRDVYDWCREHTPLTEEHQQRTAALETRHRLEHAVRAGDHAVIRPLRCPACGTVGLHWQPREARAICVNRHCARRNNGEHQRWSLARLAYEQTAVEKTLPECAT